MQPGEAAMIIFKEALNPDSKVSLEFSSSDTTVETTMLNPFNASFRVPGKLHVLQKHI